MSIRSALRSLLPHRPVEPQKRDATFEERWRFNEPSRLMKQVERNEARDAIARRYDRSIR